MSKASERPRKPSVFQLVVTLVVTLNVGVVGLLRQDGGWDLAIALIALAVGVGYGLTWLRDDCRYRAALQQLS